MKLSDFTPDYLRKVKKLGFTDRVIAKYVECSKEEVRAKRKEFGVCAVFKMVDTCAAEFDAVTPYYYSTYDEHCEAKISDKKKVLVIGSGPIRIGQGLS